jgi:anti-sigma factor RsiW
MKTTATATTCEFPRERLVAYRDGDLRAARLEIVQAHLAACAECRRWLDELDTVTRLLHEQTPRFDDPAARARLKTGIEQLPPPRQRRASVIARGRVFALALLALVALLGLSFWREPLADGGSSFTHWFRSSSSPRRPVGGDRISAPGLASPVAGLPYGLALEPAETVDGQPTVRRLHNAAGLALRLDIDRSGGGYITLPDDPEHSQIVGVAGHDVLVLYGLAGDDVAAMYWTDGAVRYQMIVISAPPGGFRLDAALRVAAALMAVDWSVS